MEYKSKRKRRIFKYFGYTFHKNRKATKHKREIRKKVNVSCSGVENLAKANSKQLESNNVAVR